jgi:hypothetical protein
MRLVKQMKYREVDFLSLRLCLCLFLSLSLSLGFSQASISVNKTEALIGDQLKLTLQIYTPSTHQWTNQDIVPGDTAGVVEVITTDSLQQTQDGDYTQYLKTWTIAVFDTGLIRVQAMPVVLKSSVGEDTQYTNDIPLMISGVVDSLGLAPIKPIVREPAKLSDYLPYIIIAVILIILIIAGIIYSRRKPKTQKVVEVRDLKPPHVIALEALDALEREKLWQQGLIKEYHSRMNHIMRTYLEQRYQIPALESTSTEIIYHLRKINLSDNLLQQIREVMMVEDLIKFAKAEPAIDIHAQYLEFARALILQTKAEPQTTTENV